MERGKGKRVGVVLLHSRGGIDPQKELSKVNELPAYITRRDVGGKWEKVEGVGGLCFRINN